MEDLQWHRINNLECIYAPEWAKIKETIKFDDFKIDLKKLRHSISNVFGIQIAKYGRIVDFSCANYIWDKIKIKR